MIRKIDHVNIVVRDIETAKQFFVDLGFVIKKEGVLKAEWLDAITNLSDVEAEFAAVALPNDSVAIEILKFRHPKGGRDEAISQLNQIGFRHLAFEVDNIEAEVSRLQAKGIHFLSEPQLYPEISKKLCYFIGPEGIILELAQFGAS